VNAAEHFAAAERCLNNLTHHERGSDTVRELLAEAQVHATLAVAASQMRSLPAAQAEADGG
jgi:hypothetical protein